MKLLQRSTVNFPVKKYSVLRFGLKHGLATRPKESDIIAATESIWDELKRVTA
jgi:hypothetical protein